MKLEDRVDLLERRLETYFERQARLLNALMEAGEDIDPLYRKLAIRAMPELAPNEDWRFPKRISDSC